MAGTKMSASRRRAARLASAGPGQNPATPQPIPKIAEPTRSRTLIGSAAGPGSVESRRRSRKVPRAKTATAPAITKRSVGSQRPTTSRKPRTRAGLVMPESASPTPKIAPERTMEAERIISGDNGKPPEERGGEDAEYDKGNRGDDGVALRASDSTDTVPAGAAAADARAQADQQTANGKNRSERPSV